MEKRQLLFVTHRNEHMTEGVSYAIELAKAMNEDILILFVQKPANLNEKFEGLMSAVAFAEAGDHDTAKKIAGEGPQCLDEVPNQDLVRVFDTCLHEGVRVNVHTSPFDALSGIRNFIKKQGGIDKIVLSPAVTKAGAITARDMTRLARSISRPVVTMARQPLAVAGGAEQA